MTQHAPKSCAVCGREIQWRKKWERDWEAVKYCSKSCRSRGVSKTDEMLEASILLLLRARVAGGSICPSEAARAVIDESRHDRGAGASDSDGWRSLMEAARMAARRLVGRGEVEITQRDRVVDPSTAKGPIRIRLTR
ncbi:MAG: DUF2256 and DUF3253 domain-containing protein [Planctomycetota bacterium]